MRSLLQIAERPRQGACEHTEHVSTVNFGLERIVCLGCGSVTMRKASDGKPGTLFRVPHPMSGSESVD